jgi:hypothetical protein
MRNCFWFCVIVLSAWGVALAQDTNFATGPQYLMNYGSPLFARPISTPSLSLGDPPLAVGASDATGGLTAGAENQTALVPPADALPQVDFFTIYYGDAPVSVVEISFAQASSSRRELPSSILDTGVWQVTTAEGLRERGFGLTLPEAAAYGKARTRHAGHVYTNADIDRVHTGS